MSESQPSSEGLQRGPQSLHRESTSHTGSFYEAFSHRNWEALSRISSETLHDPVNLIYSEEGINRVYCTDEEYWTLIQDTNLTSDLGAIEKMFKVAQEVHGEKMRRDATDNFHGHILPATQLGILFLKDYYASLKRNRVRIPYLDILTIQGHDVLEDGSFDYIARLYEVVQKELPTYRMLMSRLVLLSKAGLVSDIHDPRFHHMSEESAYRHAVSAYNFDIHGESTPINFKLGDIEYFSRIQNTAEPVVLICKMADRNANLWTDLYRLQTLQGQLQDGSITPETFHKQTEKIATFLTETEEYVLPMMTSMMKGKEFDRPLSMMYGLAQEIRERLTTSHIELAPVQNLGERISNWDQRRIKKKSFTEKPHQPKKKKRDSAFGPHEIT